MPLPKIGIIGCGWLGKALASHLSANGYALKVTTRTKLKQQALLDEGFDTCLLSTDDGIESSNLIFDQDILVIAITPGFKRGYTDYALNIANLVQCAENKQVKKIVLISSTGIYQGLEGEVDENTSLNLSQHKSKILFEAEQSVVNFSGSGKVLRLSGLVSENRKPGKFLAGKKALAGANAAVNLIHRSDCIGLLQAIIEQEVSHKIFIGVSNTHCSKSDFYSQAARHLGLVAPEFDLTKADESNRKVLGENTRNWLNYAYQKDDLLHWLKHS